MATKTGSASSNEPVREAKGPGRSDANPWAALAANCCLLFVGVAGGVLLAWWALSFHQSNEQLWMVPVGLVLLGTPIVAWLSVFASGVCRSLELLWAESTVPQAAPPQDLEPER